MGKRTCGSYSLPCFAFPVPVDRVDRDVIRGHGLQLLQRHRGDVVRDLDAQLAAAPLWLVRHPVTEDSPGRRPPPHPHRPLRLIEDRQRPRRRRH